MEFLCYFSGKTRSVDGEAQKLIDSTLQKGYDECVVVGVGEHKKSCSALSPTQPCHRLGGVDEGRNKTGDYQSILPVLTLP